MGTRTRRPVVAINTLSVPGERLGGGFTYLRNLLPRLIAAAPGARFHLLVTKSNWRFFAADNPQAVCTMLSDFTLRGAARTMIERGWVNRWLSRIAADLYFVPYGWLPRDTPCPTVWTFQNLLLLDFAQRKQTTPRTLFHRLRERVRTRVIAEYLLPQTLGADRIIAVSETARDRLTAEYPGSYERIVVVPEGVGDQFIPGGDPGSDRAVRERHGLTQPYCLSISTLMRHKRLDLLIRAFAQARQHVSSPAMLVIAGDDWGGHRRTLERIAAEVSGNTFVRFLGHVPPADLPALYRGAMMFALFSTCEAFGLPALEAMACGCPTVVANTSGLAEIVADGGLLVDPADFDGMVRTLSSLLMSPERRAELARAGLLRAAKFSWARAAQQTVAVFEELLGLPIVATSERVASELIPAEVS